MEQSQFELFMNLLRSNDYDQEEISDYLSLPDFDIKTNFYEAISYIALQTDDVETFKEFVSHPSYKWDSIMGFILTFLYDNKKQEFIDVLLDMKETDVNAFDGYLLTKAAYLNDYEMVRKLIIRLDLDFNVAHGVAIAYSIYHKNKGDDQLYALLKADVRTNKIFSKFEDNN